MDTISQVIISVLAGIVALLSAGHALILKRDPKAAIGWIVICFLIPFVGPFLYYLFGINRVRTRAHKLRGRFNALHPAGTKDSGQYGPYAVAGIDVWGAYAELVHVSDVITNKPLVSGNQVEVLHNGEQAYPAMLEAIEGAQRSLLLTTYIFETNRSGRSFIDALCRAAERGVDVRIIIDGFGDFYSFPRASRLLKKCGLRVAVFLPPRLIPPSLNVNLRNHRKILVADGRVGFTGGMNIGDRHLAERYDNSARVIDVHFRLKGPVVEQIEQVFMEDWGFLTGEYDGMLSAEGGATREGSAICRVITEGPNEDMDKLAMILIGAVSAARKSVTVMTPYFIPLRGLLSAFQAAALRGVQVSVILPAKNNLSLVHWATRNMLWELLKRGVHVYYQPPPFVHTKLVIVDECYLHIGSANIDPRSLRLNFELAVEVYDKGLAALLTTHVEHVRKLSQPVTLAAMDGRSLPERVRDSLAWLLSPYL